MEDDRFVEMETVQKALEKYVPDHDKILELLDFSSKTRCEITAETIAVIQERFPPEPTFTDTKHNGYEPESEKTNTNFRDYVGNRGQGFNQGYRQAVLDIESLYISLKSNLNSRNVRVSSKMMDQMFTLIRSNYILFRDRMNAILDYDSEEKELKISNIPKENLDLW